MAIYDNCNNDKFTTNLWCFRNAFDCFSKFNQFWLIKRCTYIVDINIWMEKMCFYWNIDTIRYYFDSS